MSSTATTTTTETTTGTIKKLGDGTVRKIKSGQVILEAKSVVKELIENGIDAGATRIDVKVSGDGGLDLIAVTDNGSGIAAADRHRCALGHHTSKIEGLSDLGTLATYGFRGEALHAIAEAAGSVSILTRSEGDPRPVTLVVGKTGEVASSAPAKGDEAAQLAGGRGTRITVSKLFSSLPVRREQAEAHSADHLRKIHDTVILYALARPDVHFQLRTPDPKFRREACANFSESVSSIYGPLIADELQQVEWESTDASVKITGLLPGKNSAPGIVLRKKNDRQFLFINRRPVDVPSIAKMVRVALRKWFSVSDKRFPFVLLNLAMNPDLYDVNVEPDKRKVLLKDEDRVLEHVSSLLMSLFPPKQEEAHDGDILSTQLCVAAAAAADAVPDSRKTDDVLVDMTQTQVAKPRKTRETGEGSQPHSKKQKQRQWGNAASEDLAVEIEADFLARVTPLITKSAPKNSVVRVASTAKTGDAMTLSASDLGALSAIGIFEFPRSNSETAASVSPSLERKDWAFAVLKALAAGGYALYLLSWFRAEEVAGYEETRSKCTVSRTTLDFPVNVTEADIGDSNLWKMLTQPTSRTSSGLAFNGFTVRVESEGFRREVSILTVPQGLAAPAVISQVKGLLQQLHRGVRNPISEHVATIVMAEATAVASSLEGPPSLERGSQLLQIISNGGIMTCPHGKDLFTFLGTAHPN